MATQKTSKSSKQIKQDRTKVFDWSFDLQFRKIPYPLSALDALAEELFYWALNDETATRLSKFFTKKTISGTTLKRWMGRSVRLKAAHSMAKIAIAERREDGALFRKMDPTYVYKTMPLYDKDYEKLEEWRAALNKKSEQDEKTTTFNITIPTFKGKNDDGSGESV